MRVIAAALCTAAILSAAEAGAVRPAGPAILEQQDFEHELAATGWRFHAWSRSTERIPAAILDVDGGKTVGLTAVDAGAVGISSRIYSAHTSPSGWRLTFRVKAMDGYANNSPWVFVAASGKDGTFLPPAVDLAPPVKVGAAWSTVTVEVAKDKLPAGAESLIFNLATVAVKGRQPAGSLLIDDVRIDALP